MEFRPLDITVISAEGLKKVNILTKMDVFVVVSISGDFSAKRKTPADKDGDSNPRWNHPLKFCLDEPSIKNKSLLFVIKSDRTLGDKDIGEVSVPIIELLDNTTPAVNDGGTTTDHAAERVVEYQVRTMKGIPKGSLRFSYAFGEKFTQEIQPNMPTMVFDNGNEPVTAFPPAGPYSSGGAGASYQPLPGMMYGGSMTAAPYSYGGYSTPPGYGAYPPPQYSGGYNGWPQQYGGGYHGYPPATGYGYPPQQQPYGYQQQGQQPKKKKGGGKLGLGIGAGILGGLLAGEVVEDMFSGVEDVFSD